MKEIFQIKARRFSSKLWDAFLPHKYIENNKVVEWQTAQELEIYFVRTFAKSCRKRYLFAIFSALKQNDDKTGEDSKKCMPMPKFKLKRYLRP